MAAKPHAQPALIGLDWGTTSLRAYLFDAHGAVLDRRDAPDGIVTAAGVGFETVFNRHVAAWRAAAPASPVLAAGMIGSRNGWRETPYLAPPAGAKALARGLVRFDAPGGAALHLVPGLAVTGPDRAPDVMRGEETELVGLADRGAQAYVLPGSHSKWAQMDGAQITDFRTYVTGELFAALCDHTILAALAADGPFDSDAFEAAVLIGAERGGALLHLLFGGRTRALFGDLAPTAVRDHLSGLLIGAELADALGPRRREATKIVIAGRGTLADRYRRALRMLNYAAVVAPPDAAAAGLWRIALAADLVADPEGDGP